MSTSLWDEADVLVDGVDVLVYEVEGGDEMRRKEGRESRHATHRLGVVEGWSRANRSQQDCTRARTI